jgi:hypothetical protein
MRTRLWRGIRRRPLSTVFGIVALIFFVGFAVGLHFKSSMRASVHWDYWIQILTGNWGKPPEKSSSRDHYISNDEYIAGVMLAILVNLGAYTLIFGAFWNLIRERRRKALLEFKRVLDVFENTSKAALLDAFAPPGSSKLKEPDEKTKEQIEETVAKLNEGFAHSRGATIKILIEVFGRDQVDAAFGKGQVDAWLHG